MPFCTRRSSTRGTPRGLLGRSGAITRHSKSVRSYRLMHMLNQISHATPIPFMGSRPSLRHIDFAKVWPLDHDGNDTLLPVEHVCWFACRLDADVGHAVDAPRVAAHHVDDLILLVPAFDTRILCRVELQVRGIGRHPYQSAALLVGQRQMDLATVGRC